MLRSLISSVLMFSLLASLFHGPVATAETTDDESGGLQFRLSNGVERPGPTKQSATASDLSQSETENILQRLPPMKTDSGVVQEIALREGPVPPPRTGNTIETSFPASGAAPEPVPSGPLEVLRYSPEGSVPIAPELSITFSHPMVALTSQDEAATNLPVKLNPQPPGKWRWLGTKTLVFAPDGRFPMATTYVVTVPAGTRAANGSTFTSEKSWSFTTPPPSVKSSYPSSDGTHPRDALMFIEFDQRIDPTSVLPAIRVSSGDRILKTRLATAHEVKQAALRESVNDKWLAFSAVDPLPAKSRIRVSLISGAPSAEGPNLTQKPYDFWFSTYGPLTVTKHGCEENPCKPHDSFEIDFSNALADDFDESKIKVEPALDDMETFVNDSTLSIDGIKRGDTTYRVTLDKSIKDKFNQTLDRDLTFTFRVGPGLRRFLGPRDFVVMDHAAPTRCSVFSINYTTLKIRLYSVTPNDWPKWIAYQREREVSKSNPRRPDAWRDKPVASLSGAKAVVVGEDHCLRARPDAEFVEQV